MIVNPEPLTYNSVKNILSLLRKEYDFAGYEVIGRSWTGKAVFSLSIGDGNEKVLFLGGMRGKEQITTLLLLRFFERMCDAVKNDKKISAVKIRKSLQNRKITIVPLVSPDALDIAAKRADGAGVYAGLVARAAKGDYSKWNANARGVDISRNFNFRHDEIVYDDLSFSGPAPQLYAGPVPESEPETKAVANLCEAELFRYAFCLTVGGEKIYWSADIRFAARRKKRGSEAFANGSAHSIADLHLKSLSGPKSLPPWRISTFSTTDLKKC